MKNILILSVLCCATITLSAQKDEEAAIKAVIDLETNLYANNPIQEVWQQCWLMDDKTVMNMCTADGTIVIHDKASMEALPNIVTGVPGAQVEQSGYQFDIKGGVATVSFETLINLPDYGIKIISYEIRVFRKVAGQWRVHMTTLHQKMAE
jgi:hypothetical protein